MFIRQILTTLFAVGISSTAMANSGTPEEQAACRPDVRRFCAKLPAKAPDGDFLACLQTHREKLTPKCLAVLTSHGQ
jgi:hypothetical protein